MDSEKVVFTPNENEQQSVNIQKNVEKKLKINPHSVCLFERSTGNTVNLKYDSKVLEDYYQECSLPHSLYRFRISVIFSILICIVWIIYFFIKIDVKCWYLVGLFVAMGLYVIFIALTLATQFFKVWHSWLYIAFSICLSVCTILPFFTIYPSVSLMFNLFFNIQVILLLYTTIPIRLWQAILMSTLISLIFIILVAGHYALITFPHLFILILINLITHIVGLMHHLMFQARRRSTFLKLGGSAKLKGDIKAEQKSKQEMIQSLMPADVAEQVMSGQVGDKANDKEKKSKRRGSKRRRQSEKDDDSSDEDAIINPGKEPRKSTQGEKSLNDGADIEAENNSGNLESPSPTSLVSFRKFHVSQMENVSILFADIVGFTKMSSNKTAPHLVFLLNDLFGSFDQLCERNGCEKIATLGDCYYCVSGCPKAELNHAERCVEMGRSMCHAIRQFDERHLQEVNMRVGVHTGMVICGIVGTQRFKFDVWSHDVTIANEMESSGQAGRVHISQETYAFVKDIYEVEDGQSVPDIRKLKVLVEYFDEKSQSYAIKHEQDQASIMTYFILKRFDDKSEILLISDEDNVKNVVQFSELQNEEMEKIEKERENNVSIEKNDATEILLPESNEKARQESIDNEMVSCFKEECGNQIRSFFEPPINYLTLKFTDDLMEEKYHRTGLKKHGKKITQLTWASLRITPLINAIVSSIFVIAIIIACFIGFPYDPSIIYSNRSGFYIALVLTVIFNLIFVIPLIYDFTKLNNISRGFDKFYRVLFNWYFRNVYGIIIIGMPSVMVLCHFDICLFQELHVGYRLAMGIMLLFMLCNCTLFTIYSSWTKSCIASLVVAISLAVLFKYQSFHTAINNAITNCSVLSPYLQLYYPSKMSVIGFINSTSDVPIWMKGNKFIDIEIVIVLLLTLVFIWYLNREMDISFRATFSGDHQAIMAKKAIAQERKQADWLLENIIPSYVIEDIKKYKKYSKHIEQVGVIFATIANFGDFYDEQFEGGREMLRVLNEIFADFENLLSNQKYKDVQKIKTIGACFMVASGLNPIERAKDKNSKAHLHALMDFSMELINTLNAFNEQLFNFNFELKIGYNIGDVTAGVIGTTKLLYDIWGDTVNVASRMYSTGEKGRIQVTDAVAQKLENRYEFKYRGEVEVKGKGKMQTFLVEGRKKRDNVSPSKQ